MEPVVYTCIPGFAVPDYLTEFPMEHDMFQMFPGVILALPVQQHPCVPMLQQLRQDYDRPEAQAQTYTHALQWFVRYALQKQYASYHGFRRYMETLELRRDLFHWITARSYASLQQQTPSESSGKT